MSRRLGWLWVATLVLGCAGKIQWSASTSGSTTGGSSSTGGGAATDDAAAFKAGGSYAVQKNRVVRERARVDADSKNPDAIDAYATAIMDVYNTSQAQEDTSVNWNEHAQHAIGLTKDAAGTAPTPERKGHFHLLRAVLLKHQ